LDLVERARPISAGYDAYLEFLYPGPVAELPQAETFCVFGGAPNASPGFDKLMIFFCAHCGNAIEVKEQLSLERQCESA
jgi:hypothetical protein